MNVVVITDRALCADPIARIRELAALGVGVQIREKDLDGGPLYALARAVIAAAPHAPVWINDRADLARALDAGVHLPEAGLPIAAAKAFGVLSIAASRHDAVGAAAAARDGAELVQLGPIFDTPGKRGVGTDLLRVAVPARIVAVGGIDSPERAFAAAAAGADAVAVIRAAWTSVDPVGVVRALIDAVERGRAARQRMIGS